jgi:hypothetical protein
MSKTQSKSVRLSEDEKAVEAARLALRLERAAARREAAIEAERAKIDPARDYLALYKGSPCAVVSGDQALEMLARGSHCTFELA